MRALAEEPPGSIREGPPPLTGPDVDNRAEWAKRLGIDWRDKRTPAEKQKAQADEAAQAKRDKQQGGFWLSSAPEFAGSMMAGGPGAAAKIGGAARAAESAAPAIMRRFGFGAGERQMVPFAQGSLTEARAADKAAQAAGTIPQGRVEQISRALPGGGPLRAAKAAADVRGVGLQTNQIADNLAAGVEQRISTAPGKFKGLAEADRGQVAAFWRVGGPDHVFQALTRSSQDPKLLGLIQQATTVLSPGSQRYVASEMIRRMGQGANGAFSAETFLRNWKAVAPGARDAMFGARALGSDYAQQMTKLASDLERIQAYAASTPMSKLRSILPAKSGSMGIAAAGIATFALGGVEGVEALLHMLLSPKAALIGGLVSGSNVAIAHALTNPATVKWLAAQTEKMVAIYESQQPDQFSEMPTSPTRH